MEKENGMSGEKVRLLAQQHGIELSEAQTEQIQRQFVDGELSDMELESVAGAGDGTGAGKGGKAVSVGFGPGVGYGYGPGFGFGRGFGFGGYRGFWF